MNNPAYYLEYEDGLGAYWKCFDGDDGLCISTRRTKQESMSWCRGWNHILLNEIGYPPLSRRQWKKWFPGCPNSKHTYNAYKENQMHTLAPTTCTSTEVPCQKGPDPRYYDVENFNWIYGTNGWTPTPKEKGNNPMYTEDCIVTTPKKCSQANAQSVIQVITDSKPDTTVSQRTFLERRVHDIKYVKYGEISEQFYLHEPAGPKTVAELKERLKKGLYTVALPKGYGNSDFDEDEDEIYWRDAFSWRTPETQYDKVGYEAAYKELDTFIRDILDQIAILDPKEGLALLDDLKKWKPSKAKK